MRVAISMNFCFPTFDFYQQNFLSSVILTGEWKDFACVEILRPSQPIGVLPSVVSLPNHTFIGQA